MMTKPAGFDCNALPQRFLLKGRFIGWIYGERGTWKRYDKDALVPVDGHLCFIDDDGVTHRAEKLPVCPRTMRAASVSDPTTWGSYGEASALVAQGKVDGVGYVLDRGEAVVDLDGCMIDGAPNEFAATLVAKLCTYTEVSVSGMGLHLICLVGEFEPTRGCKAGRCEVYVGGHTNRFITMTGSVFEGYDELDEDAEDVFYDFYHTEFENHPVRYEHGEGAIEFPEEGETDEDGAVVAWLIGHYKHGRELFELGDISKWAEDRSRYVPNADRSRSEADFALAKMLLAATSGNAQQALRLLRRSAMRRSKYDEIHDGTNDYATMTVRNALETCDVRAMVKSAIKRRDERLSEYPESFAPLVELMKRDDVTHYMLQRVMCTRAKGTARRRWRDPIESYPLAWMIRWWDELAKAAYSYDFRRVG